MYIAENVITWFDLPMCMVAPHVRLHAFISFLFIYFDGYKMESSVLQSLGSFVDCKYFLIYFLDQYNQLDGTMESMTDLHGR